VEGKTASASKKGGRRGPRQERILKERPAERESDCEANSDFRPANSKKKGRKAPSAPGGCSLHRGGESSSPTGRSNLGHGSKFVNRPRKEAPAGKGGLCHCLVGTGSQESYQIKGKACLPFKRGTHPSANRARWVTDRGEVPVPWAGHFYRKPKERSTSEDNPRFRCAH